VDAGRRRLEGAERPVQHRDRLADPTTRDDVDHRPPALVALASWLVTVAPSELCIGSIKNIVGRARPPGKRAM
jgi:hypothetical protein